MIMEDEVNTEYIGDQPYSFGGRYRSYDVKDLDDLNVLFSVFLFRNIKF